MTKRKTHHVGEPDHKLGYRVKTLQDRLTRTEFEALDKWMHGQTCAADENGLVYYEWDVKRFFEIEPGKEVWD